MQNKIATLCLFFPEPLDDIDKANILASGVMRVQLFFGVAQNFPDQLRWLASIGRRVILRIEEPSRNNASQVLASYYTESNHAGILAKVAAIKQLVPVEAVICGNEPEIEYDLRRSDDPNANWGDKPEPLFPKGRAWHHQYAMGRLREALATIGVLGVAPGWSHRRKVPREDPEPGEMTWVRICSDVYNQGPAGSHDYAENWLGDEDYNCYLWRVGEELERIHSDVWVNESSIGTHTLDQDPIARMVGITEMYDLLAAQSWTGPIKSFCPFVSNGRQGEGWSNMIMRDPRAYEALGSWLAR